MPSQSEGSCLVHPTDAPTRDRMLFLNEGVPEGGMRRRTDGVSRVPWRISPEPFPLRAETVARLEQLGDDLLAFYRAANHLYLGAAHGRHPDWVRDYFERGKTERVRELGALRRYRTQVPRIMRPDLMALEDGSLHATELDAVPGGFGSLAAFSRRYASLGFDLVGGGDGLVRGLADMFRDVAPSDAPTVAMMVSDESADYRAEMGWMADALREVGLNAHVIAPHDVRLDGDALTFEAEGRRQTADVVYRFLELHDLPNVPNIDLVIYAMKHRLARVTPPFKSYLEEKLLFALYRHPELEGFWRGELGADVFGRLLEVFAETWVLDARPIPPSAAVCPPLETAGKLIRRWEDLYGLSQKQRRLVIKPSGFSELAWGSRGVTIGHDVPGDTWDADVRRGLNSFDDTPYVVQPFYESRRVPVRYFDFEADEIRQMDGRARVSPFYYVVGDEAVLAGVLVTVVPSPNKVIHGTPEAVLAPAMISDSATI